jgi:hypothetical protein
MVPPDHTEDPEAPPPSEGPSRPLTIDDVPRLGSGTGIAIGCAAIVAAAILVFWLIRGLFMHG